ncbi:MAG: hypothetical protein O8C66_13240 [Candidatus Methanoperedens sp.]|nr:hypothetical protein [Candidatus Methanoperedens sp.]MCZ7371462.1 hypothetical protein [Candidatus Methanoperedens sp.]
MVVDTDYNEVDNRSLRSYGIHGALGLLIGIGIAVLIAFILGIMISFAIPIYFNPGFLPGLVFVLIFVIYGAYVGHILGGREGSIRLLKMGLLAGVFSGTVFTAFLAANLIDLSNPFNYISVSLFVIAVSMFAFPRPKNMLLLVAFSILGSALGYGVYLVGDNIAAYLNSALAVNFIIVFIITTVFLLVSIGIPGASIAIGMYILEGTTYTKHEIPMFLKILRIVGIVLTLIILLVASITIVNMAKYASISSETRIATNGEKTTIYVPVLLDENGKVLEMYEKPKLTGDAAAEIIETNHGKALKISGSGVFAVSTSQKFGRLSEKESTELVNRFVLSMSNTTHFGVGQRMYAWIYSESDVNEFRIDLTMDNGRGRILSINEEPIKLAKGWQEVR